MTETSCETVVVGAGLAGLAAADAITRLNGAGPVLIVDARPPCSFTSACSGDNYRNWWPDPEMTALINDSIDRMAAIARATDNRIGLKPGGYLLATRDADTDGLVRRLERGYDPSEIAVVQGTGNRSAATSAAVIVDPAVIRARWPHFHPDIAAVVHIRRAGHLDGNALGQWLLEQARARGAVLKRARIRSVTFDGRYHLSTDRGERLHCERLVLAGGPFINELAGQLGEPLPVRHVLQQKLALADPDCRVPRDQPFCIDLDAGPLDFDPDTRAQLAQDPDLSWVAGHVPGGSHCRPHGAGSWIKLGWAVNRQGEPPVEQPQLDPWFPELAVRAAARLNPALGAYAERMPEERSHYGGYYSMTEENWPLIGPLKSPGAFVVGALSGFGTMAACGAGALIAAWLGGGPLPGHARDLSLERYDNPQLLARLRADPDRGVV